MQTLQAGSSAAVFALAADVAPPTAFNTLGVRDSLPATAIALTGDVRLLKVTPLGVGGVGDTFGLRIVGVQVVTRGGLTGYTQIPLFEGTCTIGPATGSDGSAVPSAYHMAADVSAPAVGADGVQFAVLTTGGMAVVLVDRQDCPYFYAEIGPGNAAGGNALVAAVR